MAGLVKEHENYKMSTKRKSKHRPGSRKERVHEVFKTKGRDAARKVGLRSKLKESTLRTWFSNWTPPRRSSTAELRR